jgi:predicted acylesterase/phospholipase RssA
MSTTDFNGVVKGLINDQQESDLPATINVLLTGGGLSSYYEYGALRYLDETRKRTNKLNIKKMYCVSGGAYFGAMFLNGIDINKTVEIYAEMREKTAGEHKGSYLCEIVKTLLEEHLPDDAHERCSNILNIFVYEVESYRKYNRRVFNKFETKKDLIEIIIASCAIPYVTTRATIEYNGKWYMDGIDIDTSIVDEKDYDPTIPSFLIDLEHLEYKSKHKISFTDANIQNIIMKGIEDMDNYVKNNVENKVIRILKPGELYHGESFANRVSVWVFRYLFYG